MNRCSALSVGLLALFVGGCGGAKPPVATLAVEPQTLRLAWPEVVDLEIELRPNAELPGRLERPTVFLHLLDEPGSVVRTFDHPLPVDWRPGASIRYRQRIYQSALLEPLPPGRYLLSLGLYEADLGRFTLRTSAPEIAGQEYQIATVEIPPPSANAPDAHFSEHWLPAEPTADRQILVRRRLPDGTAGTVQLGPLSGPGRIVIGLRIPAEIGPGSRLEVLDAEAQPKVQLQSTCGGAQAEVAGVGQFDVELEVPAGSAAVTCEITIDPNFKLTSSESADSTSATLELLAWRPGLGGEAEN